MPRYELILANAEETEEYTKASGFNGLCYTAHADLAWHPLARREYDDQFFGKKAPGSHTDHRHLSLATGVRKKLIRWSARSSSGYHHGYGAVMRIVRVS